MWHKVKALLLVYLFMSNNVSVSSKRKTLCLAFSQTNYKLIRSSSWTAARIVPWCSCSISVAPAGARLRAPSKPWPGSSLSKQIQFTKTFDRRYQVSTANSVPTPMTITTKPPLACQERHSCRESTQRGDGGGGGHAGACSRASCNLDQRGIWLITEWSVSTTVLKTSCGQSGVPSASD